LKLLIKDDKLAQLETMSNYSLLTVILTKMTYDQLLSREELKNFELILQPHQKAVMSDGFTIPEKAFMEHNLTAVGKIYKNIKISELAVLLSLQANRVEKVVAKMITEDRLKAIIDQTSGMLKFANDDTRDPWDSRIRDICDYVTAAAESVKQMKQ
jgi:COP9 signalosome complex subunit 4